MPQIAIKADLQNKAAQQLNQGAKTVLPDWLADIAVPNTAGTDPSDFVNPIGMVGGSKLINALLKRLKIRGVQPAAKTVDPLALEPKMDRRGFFRALTGAPARDANEARRIIHDKTFIDDGDTFTQRRLSDGETSIWDKIEKRYGDADVPPDISAMDRAYNRTGDFDAEPNLRDTLGGWADHLKENLLNEYRQALTGETLDEFNKGLQTAGTGTAKLINALLRRAGIRK